MEDDHLGNRTAKYHVKQQHQFLNYITQTDFPLPQLNSTWKYQPEKVKTASNELDLRNSFSHLFSN